jgi:hypothetical protein
MGLGSGIRKKTFSGSLIQVKKGPDPGSGSATLHVTNNCCPHAGVQQPLPDAQPAHLRLSAPTGSQQGQGHLPE